MPSRCYIWPKVIREAGKEKFFLKEVKKNACEESFLQLVLMHSAIFYKVYSKYSFIMNDYGYEKNNIEADKHFLFIKSIGSFDDKKNSKFSTWLANQTRYFCLNFINKNKKTIKSQRTPNLKNEIADESFFDEDQSSLIDVKNAIKQVKDERIREIFNSRYINGNSSWLQISKKIGYSVQTVLNLHRKGKKLLQNKLTY